MKQFLLILYKVLQEIRLSIKASNSLISIKQRAGNRYMHVFAVTFTLSILMVNHNNNFRTFLYTKNRNKYRISI